MFHVTGLKLGGARSILNLVCILKSPRWGGHGQACSRPVRPEPAGRGSQAALVYKLPR